MEKRFRFYRRVAGKSHYVLDAWANWRFPDSLHYLWGQMGLSTVDMAETVYQDGKIVGFLRYNLYDDALHAMGTWVLNGLRRNGLAQELWSRVLRRHKPERIFVTVVTKKGGALCKKLRKSFSQFEWHVLSNVK